MIGKDGINSTVDIAQSIDLATFSQQAEWWIKAIEEPRPPSRQAYENQASHSRGL